MIVLPAASIRSAPAGTGTFGPTASILPLRTTIVAFSAGALPLPSITRAPTKATVPSAAVRAAAPANRVAATRWSRIFQSAFYTAAPAVYSSRMRPLFSLLFCAAIAAAQQAPKPYTPTADEIRQIEAKTSELAEFLRKVESH